MGEINGLIKCIRSEVSVICMAYNQEKYIEQMLRSVITQKTEFRFEVIVMMIAQLMQQLIL